MRYRELQKFLATQSGRSPADLDVRGRQLRAEGLIPTGERGSGAPRLSFEHAANVLLGAIGASQAIDAARAVRLLRPMLPVGGVSHSFLRAENLGAAIEAALSRPDEAASIVELQVRRPNMFSSDPRRGVDTFDHPWTRLFWRVRGPMKIAIYAPEEHAKRDSYRDALEYGCTTLDDYGTCGGGILHQIAIDLADLVDADWNAEPPPEPPRQTFPVAPGRIARRRRHG